MPWRSAHGRCRPLYRQLRELQGYRAEQPFIDTMRRAEPPGSTAQYADLTFWLPGDILTKVDRTSGLEAREPARLIPFAARLPEKMRVRGSRNNRQARDAALLPELSSSGPSRVS